MIQRLFKTCFAFTAVLFYAMAAAQPQLVTAIPSGSRLFTEHQGSIYYVSGDSLFKNSGTGPSQFIIKTGEEFVEGPILEFKTHGKGAMASLGPTLFFVTRAGTNIALWKTNGTSGGTSKVKSFLKVGSFHPFKNKLFFAADDGTFGGELWSVDAPGTTQRITDINPGSSTSLLINERNFYNNPLMDSNEDFIFFQATQPATGTELWKSNGTPGNASLVIDLITGPESSNPSDITYAKNQIYFVQPDFRNGPKLWKTSGEMHNTELVYEGARDNAITQLIAYSDYLFFVEYIYYGYYDLKRSDGTPGGTVSMHYSAPYLSNLKIVNNKLIFAEWGGDYYITSYYITDGISVSGFISGFGDYNYDPQVYGFKDYVFYSANSPEYIDDGTLPGYREAIQYDFSSSRSYFLKDLYPEGAPYYPIADNYVSSGNYVYFTASAASDWNFRQVNLYRYLPKSGLDSNLTVSSLTLVDASTEQDIGNLANGATLGSPNTLQKNLKLNIRANVPVQVKSVKFILDGIDTLVNEAPFAYAGYSEGDYHTWIPSVGTHQLTVIPYSEENGQGLIGRSLTISFNVVVKDRVVSFTLVNPLNEQDIKTLVNGDILGSAEILSKNNHFNIRANIEGEPYKIFFTHDYKNTDWPFVPDTVSRFQAPYTLAGYNNGDYLSFTPTIARHTLTAVPMFPTSGNGGKGNALQIEFYVKGSDRVTDLVLINHDSNDSLKVINEGDILNLREYPLVSRFNIRANTNLYKAVQVMFEQKQGDFISYENDESAPFAFVDYWWSNARLLPGIYDLTATPYTRYGFVSTDASREEYKPFAGKSLRRTFRIIDEEPGLRILDYHLVNADNDTFFRNLYNGDSLDISSLPKNLNVRINSYPVNPGSIKIEYDGQTRYELYAPFALFGDTDGDLNAGTFTTGYHILTTTPYSGVNGTGVAGVSQTVRFYIYDSRACMTTGTILQEQWNDLSGMTVADIPLHTAPSSVSYLNVFETPQNTGDRFGRRIRGYVCPPVSGNYTFWISSNDNSELWLSTDDSPVNKKKVAYITSFTNYREWTKFSTQKSASIYLEQNKKYYIEALHKEEFRSDHLSVGWTLPNGIQERPMQGNRLSPYPTGVNMSPRVYLYGPQNNQSYNSGRNVSFLIDAVDDDTPSRNVYKVEFYSEAGKVAESTQPDGNSFTYPYVWQNPPVGTHSFYAVAYDSEGAFTYSDTITFHVYQTGGTPVCTAQGTILREQWDNIGSILVSSIPVNTPPTKTSLLNSFDGPQNTAERYGSRIRGYICAPQTGNYTFWISSNDNGELWLSGDDNPLNKTRIAYVNSFTNYQQWNKLASQKSSLIYLEKDKKYYIEALQKEEFQSDHLSVGWQLPDGTMERPIAGSRLSPFQNTGNLPPSVVVTYPADDQSYSAPASIVITADASDIDGTVSKVEFYIGTSKVGEDLSSPYTYAWSQVPEGIYSITAKAYDNNGSSAVSATVSVTVTGTGCSASGTILREAWYGVSGSSVSTIPTHIAPDETNQLTLFEGPSNIATKYGTRISGFICPPETGNYTFYISSNDHSELWLSADEDPANKVRIASVVGFTAPRQWDKFTSQKSSPIALVAGKKYYIEALHKQEAGTDHIAVGWQLPGGTMERPIPGTRLSPNPSPSALRNAEFIQFSGDTDGGYEEGELAISLFPNPMRAGILTLSIEGYNKTGAKGIIRISGQNGKEVYQEKLNCILSCKRTLITIDEAFKPGAYMVTVIIEGKVFSEQLVVQ